MLLRLQNKEGIIQTETRKMVEIASKYQTTPRKATNEYDKE